MKKNEIKTKLDCALKEIERLKLRILIIQAARENDCKFCIQNKKG